MIRLFVAVGNPGSQYTNTRHNIGWLAFDKLRFADELRWREKFKGEWTDYYHKDEKYYFLKPMTYMNLSGESVQPLCKFFKIAPEEICVVHDEIDLPYGRLQFKRGGGFAGHNGLKSIAQQLGTKDFYRLRMGVSKPRHGDVANWVLSNFSEEEKISLDDFLDGAAKAMAMVISQGYEKASSRFSKKNYAPEIKKEKE